MPLCICVCDRVSVCVCAFHSADLCCRLRRWGDITPPGSKLKQMTQQPKILSRESASKIFRNWGQWIRDWKAFPAHLRTKLVTCWTFKVAGDKAYRRSHVPLRRLRGGNWWGKCGAAEVTINLSLSLDSLSNMLGNTKVYNVDKQNTGTCGRTQQAESRLKLRSLPFESVFYFTLL